MSTASTVIRDVGSSHLHFTSQMRSCMLALRQAVDRYLIATQGDDTMDGAFSIASYIISVVRNVTSLLTILTRTVEEPKALAKCVAVISEAMGTFKTYSKEKDSEFSDTLITLGVLPNPGHDDVCTPCNAAMASFLSAMRSEYARLRYFVLYRTRVGEMRAQGGNDFLEATIVFTGRATEAMLCYSFASLQLLTYMSAFADETKRNSSYAGEIEKKNDTAFHLLSILDDAELYRLLAPLHQKIVLYGVVMLC